MVYDRNWVSAVKELKEILSLAKGDKQIQPVSFMGELVGCAGKASSHYIVGTQSAKFTHHNFVVSKFASFSGKPVESFLGRITEVVNRTTGSSWVVSTTTSLDHPWIMNTYCVDAKWNNNILI